MKKFTIFFVIFMQFSVYVSLAQWERGASIRTSSCETLTNIRCLASDGEKLFLGANNVKCSTNNGMSWITASIPLQGTIYSINSLKYHNNKFYAATTEGVFVADDPLFGWAERNYGINNKYVTSIVLSNNTLYASSYHHGLFQSTNSGITWRHLNYDSSFISVKCMSF